MISYFSDEEIENIIQGKQDNEINYNAEEIACYKEWLSRYGKIYVDEIKESK